MWTVLTAASGDHRELLQYGVPTLERYATRWGMDLSVPTITPQMTEQFPASWWKIRFMLDLLAGGKSGVLWVDADAKFVRFDEDIRTLAKAPFNWVHNRYRARTEFPWEMVPCTGVLAVTNRGVPALESIWALRDKHRDSCWVEQSAAHEVFGWDSEGIHNGALQGELPARWNYMPGPFSVVPDDPVILHASGATSMADRLAVLR